MSGPSLSDVPNYGMARLLSRGIGPWGRLLLGLIVAINGFAFYFVVPGWIGLALATPFLLVAAGIILGQLLREFEVRVLGRSRSPEVDD